jgi:drug/metabolite transporter (DMT)-like permease
VGFSYVIVMLASRTLFSEPITAVRWMGAVFISLGVILISRS